MILHAICYLTKSLQCFVEHIINLIVAKLSLEVADGGVFVDVDIFNAYHLGKIFPVLCRHIIGEGAVVGTTGKNPCASTYLEGGLGHPESGSHGELGHGLGLDALHFAGDEAETIAKVNDGGLDTSTCLGGEHQTGGGLLTDTDTEEMNLECGLVDSDERTNLKHMTLETGCAVVSKVEGVIFEERTTLG